jgi:hypothetical protein
MFDRWGLWRDHTWAFHLFRQHHTEVNQLYWSLTPLFRHAQRAHRSEPDLDPLSLLKLRTVTRHELRGGIEWARSLKDAENWIRLNSVMAVSSYFEVYLKKVTTLALESDPGVEHGKPRAVDGFEFRKRNGSYDRTSDASGCWIGDWSSRVASYRRLFGEPPAPLVQSIGELDSMRRMRNGIGHTFGRTVETYESHTLVEPPSMARISEKRLQKWLGLVHDVASAVDDSLGSRHIGEYETLCYFHDMRSARVGARGDGWPTYFCRQVGSVHGTSPGRTFARDMNRYYRAI